MRTTATTWHNWSKLASATPARVVVPADVDEVVAAVRQARDEGLTVKMIGSGHSFTGIAVADGVQLRPDRLTGPVIVDDDSMTATAPSGLTLHELNDTLARSGVGLHNMGDVDRQTIGGAIGTGTHGTGGRWASLSAQVAGLELVDGQGNVVSCSPDVRPDLFSAARLGLGAVGIVTSVTFMVEPTFVLEAVEAPLPWAETLDRFDELADQHSHFEFYWFPHTDVCLTKANARTLDEAAPLSRLRHTVDDEVLSNGAFSAVTALGRRVPAAIPRLNRLSAAALSARSYSDVAHRVFISRRRVRFREMEYAVPRELGMTALRAVRSLIDASGWRIGFPIEVRHTPSDDAWLSTSYGRESVYLAFHVPMRTDHSAYFTAVERLLRDEFDGRPHWGKLHTRTAASLAPAYAHWDDFARVRDELDPDRLFTNVYLQRVLGS